MYGIIIVVLICLIIQHWIDGFYSKRVQIRKRKPRSKYNDEAHASYIIQQINLFAMQLIAALDQQYSRKPPIRDREWECGHAIMVKLKNNYKPETLKENYPTSAAMTSYTKNKGEEIALCLREKQSGENRFHELDLLKFVFLHELAHIVTPEINHSQLFWINFRFLLEFCEKNNLYHSKNYDKQNEIYCGLNVTYNPRFDRSTISFFDGPDVK